MSVEGAARSVIKVGQLGAGFIGQMHSLAMVNAGFSRESPAVRAGLEHIADQNAGLRAQVAERYGWKEQVDDWEELPFADLDLFVNAGPNDVHVTPTIAAARAGVAVFCEKPLAATAELAYSTWRAVEATGVPARCAFMHRHIPAIQWARELIESGDLGEIRQFHSSFLMNMVPTNGRLPWRFDRARAGSGVVGDLGSHHIDLARFFVGEIESLAAMTRTWSRDDAGLITNVNDDDVHVVGRCVGGASFTLTASRAAPGHDLSGTFSVEGTAGSISWAMERLNELVIRTPRRGHTAHMVTRSEHPRNEFWLPAGEQGAHPVGWNECFAYQSHDMLGLASGLRTRSRAATFEDGYRTAEVVDTILRAAAAERTLPVEYRDH